MSTKREDERNEKIIRGLMKLPPNRRCLNCNSLGPQYVCTDFWTFICTTCSGIHREFTHRVKSVSMSKFTSQEVDALQKGGNQRARELFLKSWDPHRRLPDNSNIEKVRQFIKNTYVDKTYSVEKSSEHSSRDFQGIRSPEDQTRRASSYHSYSQSPPYDFQYEERRYGKHAFGHTKKPGSNYSLYEGKLASFLSPTHLNDGIFPNHGTSTQVSDYSVSGSSPCSETSGDIPCEALQLPKGQEDVHRINRSNVRASSFGGFTSFDSNSISFKSVNSLGPSENDSFHEQSAEFPHERSSSTSSQNCSFPSTFDASESTQFAPEDFSLIHFDGAETALSKPPLAGSLALPQKGPSLNLFPIEPPAISIVEASDMTMPNTRGWATFDLPENSSNGKENSTVSELPFSGVNIIQNTNPFAIQPSSSYNEPMKHEHSVLVGFEHEIGHNVKADNTGFEIDNSVRSLEPTEPATSGLASNLFMEINFPSLATGVNSLTNCHRPTNPFDLPNDHAETESMFWDMSALQTGLPNSHEPDHLWFPEDPLGFVAPSNQIQNIHAQGSGPGPVQGSVASVGGTGNPFA